MGRGRPKKISQAVSSNALAQYSDTGSSSDGNESRLQKNTTSEIILQPDEINVNQFGVKDEPATQQNPIDLDHHEVM